MVYGTRNTPSVKTNILTVKFRTRNDTERENMIRRVAPYQFRSNNEYEAMELKLEIKNKDIYVELMTEFTDKPIRLLVDTGASISLISENVVRADAKLRNLNVKLFGFSSKDHCVDSSKAVDGFINMSDNPNSKIGATFHIVPAKYTGEADGFLGADFILFYRTILDFGGLKMILPENIRDKRGIEEKHEGREDLQEIDKGENNEIRINEINGKNEINEENKNFDNDSVEEMIRRTQITVCTDDKELNYYCNRIFNLKEYMYLERGGTIEEKISISTKDGEIKTVVDKRGRQSLSDNEVSHEKCFLSELIRTNETTPKKSNDWKDNDKAERGNIIFEKIKKDHCSEEEKRHIRNWCHSYPKQFHLEGDKLACTDIFRHKIILKPNTRPSNIRQYRIPQTHKRVLNEMIEDYENQGIIEKCDSNFNSPVILVAKKDDKGEKTDFRFVVDFRKLNEITEEQNFPIPLIDEIFDEMTGCEYFTTMDIKGAFHQIELAEESRDFTAFSNGRFQYRWCRMPMGLTSAPLTWQKVINTILKNFIGKGVYAYLDDIVIYTRTLGEHNSLIEGVLSMLKIHNLQLKISKCVFYAKEFEYLGHMVSKAGIKMNPKKVEVIKRYPQPKNVKQIQQFLGMCNYYRRYIKNFAHLAKPLTALCKKDNPFVWSHLTQSSFEKLKKALTEDVILAFPNFEEIFYITSDASDFAYGSVLSQGDLPNDRPIQFFSKTMNDAQRKYSAIHKELLSIVEGIRTFRPYVYGRFFIVITDSKSLCYLFDMKDCGSRLFRQKLTLLEYNFKIIHRPGTLNRVADALSRISLDSAKSIEEVIQENRGKCQVITRSNDEQITIPRDYIIQEKTGTLLNLNKSDAIFSIITKQDGNIESKLKNKFPKITFGSQWLEIDKKYFIKRMKWQNDNINERNLNEICRFINGECTKNTFEEIAVNVEFETTKQYFLFKHSLKKQFSGNSTAVTIYLNRTINVIEKEDITNIIKSYHDSLLGGHFGVEKTLKTIMQFYSWPNMTSDIREYISKCDICERAKVTKNIKAPMEISSLGSVLFDYTYIDFIGPITPESNDGHRYIFTATCDLTKFLVAVPTMDCTAATTAKCLLENILLRYNFPSKLISDNAANFNSKIIKELNRLLSIKKIFTTPYHPQSNIVERTHRTLNAYMRSFANRSSDWNKIILFATFVYNNTIHSTTGYTPHELAHGHKIQIPTNVLKRNTPYNYDNLANEIKMNIQLALEEAKEHLISKKVKNKMNYDKNTNDVEIRVDDLILIKTQAKSAKYENLYHGPYRVINVNDPYLTIMRKGKKSKIHKNLVKKSIAEHAIEPPHSFPVIELNDEENLYNFMERYVKRISANRFKFFSFERD